MSDDFNLQFLELLDGYKQYEQDLIEAQVKDGAPWPASWPFSFERFYAWLQDYKLGKEKA